MILEKSGGVNFEFGGLQALKCLDHVLCTPGTLLRRAILGGDEKKILPGNSQKVGRGEGVEQQMRRANDKKLACHKAPARKQKQGGPWDRTSNRYFRVAGRHKCRSVCGDGFRGSIREGLIWGTTTEPANKKERRVGASPLKKTLQLGKMKILR